MMREKFFTLLARAADSKTGWGILAFAGLLTVVSLFLLPRLEIQTSREGLVDKNLPVQKRYMEYTRDFGTPNQLVILLEGDEAKIRQATDDIATALMADPRWVKNVFYKIDLEPFEKAGLYYLPLEDIKKAEQSLGSSESILKDVFTAGSWLEILTLLDKQAESVSLDTLKDDESVRIAFEVVDRLLGKWETYLENPDQGEFDLGREGFGEIVEENGRSHMDAQGYLTGKLGRTKILFVQQARTVDDTEFILPFMDFCRGETAKVLKNYPDIEAGFTGWPVSIEEEIGLVQTDLKKVTMISGVLILALFLLAFRSIHRTVLVFIPLIFGILWNLGLTVYTVGHLNYLSSVFVGILFGLGIDYGVVMVRRFDEECAAGKSTGEAVFSMLQNVGPSVLTGAGTTIAAFLAIGFTDQPAFSELGIVAGTGVLCVLISSFFVLPILISKFPPKVSTLEKIKARSHSKVLSRLTSATLRFPVTVTVVLAVVIVALLTQIPKLGFDYNIDALLAKDSEMIKVAKRLEDITQYKMQYVAVLSDNLKQVRKLDPLLTALPSVLRVESACALVPPDQDEKRAYFAKIDDVLKTVTVKKPEGIPDIEKLISKVAQLTDRLETAQEDAFADGRTNLLKHLEKALDRFKNIGDLLKKPGASASQKIYEAAFFNALDKAHGAILEMLRAPEITVASLDPSLRERFVGKSGQYSTLIFPSRQIWDMTFLNEFLADVENVNAEVFGKDQAEKRLTGFSVVYRTTSRMILKGFTQASWMAGLVVLFMMILDFRKPKLVALAMFPLLAAVAATLGGLALIGHNLNLASQIAFPIMLGIGVDYGILITRRWREPDGKDLSRVVGTIGGAITLAAGTTIAGFGSLLFARHRGLIAFGEVLVIAIFVCLFCALLGLPAIIKALKLDKR